MDQLSWDVQDQQESSKAAWTLIKSDFQRLTATAAKVGAVLAILCHLMPTHYRPICDAIASVCTGGN